MPLQRIFMISSLTKAKKFPNNKGARIENNL